MSMTVVVTRNAEGRVRGFLASAMLEVASGVYTAPTMSPAVRDRVWAVLERWGIGSRDDGAVMIWPDSQASGGQRVRVLGQAPLELVETPSIVLARRPLSDAERGSLTTAEDVPF